MRRIVGACITCGGWCKARFLADVQTKQVPLRVHWHHEQGTQRKWLPNIIEEEAKARSGGRNKKRKIEYDHEENVDGSMVLPHEVALQTRKSKHAGTRLARTPTL